MSFTDLLTQFTAAVEAGDGMALAALFTEDGVYHDTFYGEFKGRSAIADMLENRFWRDATAFCWDMREPVSGGGLGYAHWLFSYESKLPGAEGKRIAFEGMSCFHLDAGLIRHYGEIFDQGIALAQTAFAPERIVKRLGREAEALRTRATGTRHLQS
jgi:ketosteroid isomerase-like protein